MSNTIQQIDFQRFCDTDADGRFGIDKPFVQGGFRYATDGRIAIKVPAQGEPDTVCEKRLPRMKDILPPVNGDWQPWPTVEPCGDCFGKSQIECDNCRHGECCRCQCGADHSCGKCDGTGNVACSACNSVGGFKFRFGESELARRFAYLIATTLPSVEYLPAKEDGGMVRFRFAGGEGAVMGLSTK